MLGWIVLLLSTAAAGIAQTSSAGNIAALRQAFYRAPYSLKDSGHGTYGGVNPAQHLRLEFSRQEARLIHPDGTLVFQLTGYGYGDRLRKPADARLAGADGRVEYRRGDLTEWYVNRPEGLEQGFTLARRPGAAGGNDPLVISFDVAGGLEPSQKADDGALLFGSADGMVLRYAGLTAVDARGRVFPSRMEVRGSEIRLIVEDRLAEYPLVVDPTWSQAQELTAPDGAAGDRFGYAVSVSGDTAVIGAAYQHNEQGGAYVFVRSAGAWSLQQELSAADGAAGDGFGWSVSVTGDTALIGAPNKNNGQGAAYVFVRSGGVWNLQQELSAADGAASDGFGSSVSVTGDTGLVGAPNKTGIRGAAYVFVRTGGAWSQQQELTASDGAGNDRFGASVSIGGDTSVIGAYNKNNAQGAAYVFTRSSGSWSQQQKLTASDGAAGNQFGWSVSVSGETAVIGAPGSVMNGILQGSAYAFGSSAGQWTQQQELTASDGAVNDRFGYSVSVSGNTAIVGAFQKNNTYGAAYGFVWNAGGWNRQQKFTASDGALLAYFGSSVSVSGDTAVIGAPGGAIHSSAQGAAYVFARQTLGTNSLLVGSAAGASSVVLSSGSPWTAIANDSFLHISAGSASGTGSAVAIFTYDAFAGTGSRTGTLTIAGQTVTVTQAGTNYIEPGGMTTLVSSGLSEPGGVAVDSSGNVYLADTFNNAIKEWSPSTQQVTTLVSSGLLHPPAVAVDGSGNVYVAASFDNAITEWSASTQQTATVVSTGLNVPVAVTVDGFGNLYIADHNSNSIEEWSASTGQVTTLVSGLNGPFGAAVDGLGNVYFSDFYNNAVKEWSASTGQVTTLVSTGLNGPYGVAVDGAGNVYIADYDNNAIKEWSASTGQVTTLVSAGLANPSAAAVDGAGNIYIADTYNNAIKEMPYAFTGPANLSEPSSAGSDSLLPVLPSTMSLAGIFAPASDQSWLTIGTIANGVIGFSFAANTSASARTAHITVLGRQIAVTQNGLAAQSISFGTLSSQVLGAQPFTVSAAASSGLAVSFTPATPAVCTVSGTTVTLVAAGACTIQAAQAGDGNYAAAASVDQSFQVQAPGTPLQITTGSVPVANQYRSYNTTLAATGGVPPYTWSVVSSTGVSLPEGMSLDPAKGIVSAAQVNGQGGYAVTVQVADSGSPSPNIVNATLNFGVNSDGTYGGCQMFPKDSIFNQRIDGLPVDTNPSHQIPSGYFGSHLLPDFGGGFYPSPGGIPFMRVPANQPVANVNLAGDGQIDAAGTYQWPFPAWPNAAIEGTSDGTDGNDHHFLILQSSGNNISGPQTGPCTLYEAYGGSAVPGMYDAGSNTWSLTAGVHYVLNSDEIAASEGTLDTGAQDLTGIPIVPLLIKYSEVPLAVQHPLRMTFTVPTNGYVWPATGCCGGSGPPQGLLYRLKASVNWQATCPASSNPQAATVLQALQQYGAYMSAHGSAGYIQGVPDVRWNDNDLACIKNFPVSDLEVVDNSALEVRDTSGQTQPYVMPATLASGTVGTAYSAAMAAVGGNPATLQWSVSSGALPPGLVLSASTGTISGTPNSTAGSPYSFGITATDSASGYASQPQVFSIGVAPGSSLTVRKSHTGDFTQGQTGATYSILVANAGTAPTSGTVTVVDTLPKGLTATAMSGIGWGCTLATLTCTRNDALSAGGSYPLTVTVNVASDAPASVTNQVSVSAGSATANASDPTTVVQLPALTVGSTHTGSFTQGQTGATYLVTVTNSGTAPTRGTVTVTESVPTGLTLESMGGNGWICPIGGATCSRSDSLAAGRSYPLTVTANVAGNAPASLTNQVSVSVGSATVNASDPTTIILVPALSIAISHSGNFVQEQTGATYTVLVSNGAAAAPTNGTVTVTESVPYGLTLVSMAGTDWACPRGGSTCTRSNSLAAGTSYPAIAVTVNVSFNAPATAINQVTVLGGGSATAVAADPTTISAVALSAGTQSFAYVANYNSNDVSAYAINAGSGVLTAVSGSPFAAGTQPTFVTVTPAGKFAYVANGNSNNISAYAIDPTTGVLIGVPGSPFTTGFNPQSVNVDPTGKFAYAVNQGSDTVSVYTVNSATGALTGVSGSPFATGMQPGSMTVTPTGRFAYVSNLASQSISGYAIDPVTGALTAVPGSPFFTGYNPYSVTLDPTGQFLYAANYDSNNVSAYTVNATTGALTAVPGAPFPAGSGPECVTVDPTGQFAYVANSLSSSISAYTINAATGALAAVPGSPFATGSGPSSVTVDPTGQFVYATPGNVSAFIINPATGALTIAGSPVAAGSGPNSVATALVNGPVLSIAKSHTGNFTQGQTGATYTVTVSNAIGAGPTGGTVLVREAVPTGLTAVSLGGNGWTCPSSGTICTRSDPLASGATYPAITVTVSVANNAPASVVNQVTVTGGGSAIATTSDSTTIIPAPVLTVTSAHTGNFAQGQVGATYSITVTNSGGAATSGTVTLTDTLPSGLTATAISGGTDWSCTLSTLICTRSEVLPAGGSYQAVTVTVTVAAGASALLTNKASVWGGSSATTANANDSTTIVSSCDINGDGTANVSDIQKVINEALGVALAVHDLNGDGVINVVDVQKVITAALTLSCPAS